ISFDPLPAMCSIVTIAQNAPVDMTLAGQASSAVVAELVARPTAADHRHHAALAVVEMPLDRARLVGSRSENMVSAPFVAKNAATRRNDLDEVALAVEALRDRTSVGLNRADRITTKRILLAGRETHAIGRAHDAPPPVVSPRPAGATWQDDLCRDAVPI